MWGLPSAWTNRAPQEPPQPDGAAPPPPGPAHGLRPARAPPAPPAATAPAKGSASKGTPTTGLGCLEY